MGNNSTSGWALRVERVKSAEHVADLEVEVARLREALDHIEWTAPPSPAVCVPFCPWCGTTEADGHRFDCMRQAALR